MQQNMNQPMNGMAPVNTDAFNNPLTCCCCSSKAHPGNPREFIKAYFLVNIFFGWVGLCYPVDYIWESAGISFVLSIVGYIMAGQSDMNASVVKILVIITLVLNIIGMQITGLVAFIFFVLALSMFGAGAGLAEMVKEKGSDQLKKLIAQITPYAHGAGAIFAIIWLYFFWIWLIISI